MTTEKQGICFVVMGFGKKTDYETGRTLDLDATYEAIIKPVLEEVGIRSIRSDDVLQSGTIDKKMFEMLLRADLVIADISTGNVNAVYELGVRHGLRSRATIIMSEEEGRLHFDLNHIATFRYRHLGEDIGSREAVRARKELVNLVRAVMESDESDSPVYTFMPKLRQPIMSEEEFQDLIDETEERQAKLTSNLDAGDQCIAESDFTSALIHFQSALGLKPKDVYILQKVALATYKSKEPTELTALLQALVLIAELDPEHSNDPETTGLAGAIHKRLWKLTGDAPQLDAAIKFYRRGFEVRRDYYNGENFAYCLDLKAELQTGVEAIFYQVGARKIREDLVENLELLVSSDSFDERSDRLWIHATLAHANYALGRTASADDHENQFYRLGPAEWHKETYIQSKEAMLKLASRMN